MIVNVWLTVRADAQALVLTRLNWNERVQGLYAGPVTDRQRKVFLLMGDRTVVQKLFRVDADVQDWTLWNLYFDFETDVLQRVQDELDQLEIELAGRIRIIGAWHFDSRQVGTQFTFDADGNITGVTGTPTYPLHARILELMPDVDDLGTRPTVPSDINLLMGQTERRFA